MGRSGTLRWNRSRVVQRSPHVHRPPTLTLPRKGGRGSEILPPPCGGGPGWGVASLYQRPLNDPKNRPRVLASHLGRVLWWIVAGRTLVARRGRERGPDARDHVRSNP